MNFGSMVIGFFSGLVMLMALKAGKVFLFPGGKSCHVKRERIRDLTHYGRKLVK